MGAAVNLVPYRTSWPVEFEELEQDLRHALGLIDIRIDHIGSTSVPGLVAKDVIDVQVIVRDLTDSAVIDSSMAAIGFQQRPGEWNLRDHIPMDGPAPSWQ